MNEALHRLVDKYGVVNPAARQRTLPPALRTLHRRILRHYATQAMPPPSQLLHEWARDLDVQFDSALAQLAAADLVETEAGSTQLLGAYPFSTTQRGHTVHIQGGPTVHAYCAIDALGIPSMLGADVVITSQDPHTGEPIRVIVTDGQARWQPDTAVVALGIRSDCGRSASRSRCPYITFHGSAETAQIHQQATGRHGPILTQGQSLTVGTFLFGDLLRVPNDDELVIPILRVKDAAQAVTWYQRLGFIQESEHRFGPDMPAFVTIARGRMRLFLSEHEGDAHPDTLAYLRVRDVETIAAEFGVTVEEAPWAREIELRDLDGNRLRIGTPK